MYVTSTGGNPGGGANSAIHLMAVLGQCQSLHGSVTVNELTTVAAAYAANQFIGPSGCVDCAGGPPTAVDNISGSAPGLPNAMANAPLLVDSSSGQAAATLPTAADCNAGSPPINCLTVRRLNTVANALAACVNSAGPTSSQCVQLFDCTTPGASSTNTTACGVPVGATSPADTLQAVLSVARNPATVSTTGLFYTNNRDIVFSPIVINSVPPEFTLSLNFTDQRFGQLQDLAIDAGGNVWVTNYDAVGVTSISGSVTKIAPNGAILGNFPSNSAANTAAFGVAIDGSNNAWVSNFTNTTYSLTALNQAGTAIDGTPEANGTGGLFQPLGVAISPLNYPNGDVWVVDGYSASSGSQGFISRFNDLGSAFGSGYGLGTTDQAPERVAVDAAGYVWITENNTNQVTQLNPVGGLVNTITANVTNPYGIAVDPNGNIWIGNAPGSGASSLVKLSVSGETVLRNDKLTGGGLNQPEALAIDSAGNVWAANYNNSTVSGFNAAGTPLSPSSGFAGAGLFAPTGIGVDPSGNLWLSNFEGGRQGVTLFFGVAAPTVTPKVTAIANGFVP
jgi:streptogramin lyase